MSDRFEDMMTHLMRDVYEAQVNPQPILDLVFDETPEVEEKTDDFHVDVQSKSNPSKTHRYTTSHVSSDKSRNVQLLNVALNELVKTSDDAKKAAIREFMSVVIASL